MATKSEGSPLFNMLADLAKDPELLRAYEADRNAVMDRYGLTNEQKEAIHAALDEKRVHNLLDELGAETFRTNISC